MTRPSRSLVDQVDCVQGSDKRQTRDEIRQRDGVLVTDLLLHSNLIRHPLGVDGTAIGVLRLDRVFGTDGVL